VICLIIFAVAAWQEIREIIRVSKKMQKEIKAMKTDINGLNIHMYMYGLFINQNKIRIHNFRKQIEDLDKSVNKFAKMAITASNHAAVVNTIWENQKRQERSPKHGRNV
jgi:predicted  nucleic acid-binding Zn-ribbon protein